MKRKLLKPEKKRTLRISVTVSPEQKVRICQQAQLCNMTPSSYLMSLGLNYTPRSRLTDMETAALADLINVRADVINYANALHALNQDERVKMFRNYKFMLEWLNALNEMGKRITLFLDKVNIPNINIKQL